MDNTLSKMEALLKLTNDTFDFDLVIDGGEVLDVKIKGLKDDGSKFIADFVEILEGVVAAALPDYELVYNEVSGFSLEKR